MDYIPFPARLCSGYNNTSEFGQGQVAPNEDAIDFCEDFVPLLPLGCEATVEWMQGDKVVQAYAGQVYLSSPQMLRLVGVGAALAAQTRALFAQNISLPAAIYPSNQRRKEGGMPVKVVYLSMQSLTLQTPRPLPPGTGLLLDSEVDFLTLRDFGLTVKSQVTLRVGQHLALCTPAPINDENLIALSAYTARLEMLEGR